MARQVFRVRHDALPAGSRWRLTICRPAIVNGEALHTNPCHSVLMFDKKDAEDYGQAGPISTL